MSEKKYRKHSPELKVTVVRRHLIDKVPVSNLCEEYNLRPSHFYQWQKDVFEQALKAFTSTQLPLEVAKDKATIKRLETKLAQKNEVLAELMQEYISLKKDLGEI
jgi:transposase